MLFLILLAMIFKDGPKPLKSLFFESNLGFALKALKNYLLLQYNKTYRSFYSMIHLLINLEILEIELKKH